MKPWGTDKILKFLDKYREFPCLWDSTDQLNYRNHEAKTRALKCLIEYMNEKDWNCQQMKNKIHCIRNVYMSEKRRVLKSKKLGYNHIPKLAYYKKADSFLDKLVKNRYEICLQSNTSHVMDDSITKFEDQIKNEFDAEINNDIQLKLIQKIHSKNETLARNIQKFKKSTNHDSNLLEDLVKQKEVNNSMENEEKEEYSNVISKKVDEDLNSFKGEETKKFSLFGKYVAQQLDELPPIKAYRLEAKIQQLISDAKIEALCKSKRITF